MLQMGRFASRKVPGPCNQAATHPGAAKVEVAGGAAVEDSLCSHTLGSSRAAPTQTPRHQRKSSTICMGLAPLSVRVSSRSLEGGGSGAAAGRAGDGSRELMLSMPEQLP
jgi:hypothetical protein